jgi:GPI ethanolamine phosphate transferase 3 subunit O
MYGLITAVTATLTVICVTIQRRHLMVNVPNLFLCFQGFGLCSSCAFDVTRRISINLQVWGLFAPKYVFDAIGLLLTDLLICLASLYYS